MVNIYWLLALLVFCIGGANSQECSGRPPIPPIQPNNDCCKINLPLQQEQCQQQIMDQWDAFRQSPSKDSFKMSDMCMSNCVFNNANIVTSDNKVNSDEVQNILAKLLGPEWQPLLPNMIATCKARIDNVSPNGNGPHGQHPKSPMSNCNMSKEKLHFCLREQFLTNCPDSLWKNDNDCNDMRSFFKNCPFEKRGPPLREP